MNVEEARSSVRTVARSLVGTSIATPTRSSVNTVLGVTDEGVLVRAKTVRLVSWTTIDGVIDELFDRRRVTGGSLRRDRVPGGFRSAFIFALLSRTPFARVEKMGAVHELTLI